jgi:hypothetical protein
MISENALCDAQCGSCRRLTGNVLRFFLRLPVLSSHLNISGPSPSTSTHISFVFFVTFFFEKERKQVSILGRHVVLCVNSLWFVLAYTELLTQECNNT